MEYHGIPSCTQERLDVTERAYGVEAGKDIMFWMGMMGL
jgi:hypothetical protein